MRLERLIISIGVLLIIGACVVFIEGHKMIRDAQETFDKAEEVQLEEGQTQIVLDQAAVFGIPEGYEVAGNSYYSNATELSTYDDYIDSMFFEKTAGETVIRVAGWPSDSDEEYVELKEDAGKDPDTVIIKTPAGDAYAYCTGTNKKDQPLEYSAYIRIEGNTYCVEIENDDGKVLTEEEITEFREYVMTIDQYHDDDVEET